MRTTQEIPRKEEDEKKKLTCLTSALKNLFYNKKKKNNKKKDSKKKRQRDLFEEIFPFCLFFFPKTIKLISIQLVVICFLFLQTHEANLFCGFVALRVFVFGFAN